MSLEVGECEKCYRFAVGTVAHLCRLLSAFNGLYLANIVPNCSTFVV
jgi:hypothetical protein